MSDTSSTAEALYSQWKNPSDLSALLMVIGGDVVQKALAQGTGTLFTPVCFSFGWVTYAFVALVAVIGDGRLLPSPDYPAKVFNLKSGYVRENKNWVVGRLLRDLEARIARARNTHQRHAIRISVFAAEERPDRSPTNFGYGKLHLFGLLCILLQFCLAAVPIYRGGEWDTMLITTCGTLMAQLAGCLPQWRAEKLPNRQDRPSPFALTQGNGSKDVVVILGGGRCLDLEELCSSQSPRFGGPWAKFGPTITSMFAGNRAEKDGKSKCNEQDVSPSRLEKNIEQQSRRWSFLQTPVTAWGLPRGYVLTQVVVAFQSVAWLGLLVNVAAPRDHNWILIAVGLLGMFQNGVVAAMERGPEQRNMPLRAVDTFVASKVMDGIMDFETAFPGLGACLRLEFFPGALRDPEKQWWDGDREAYDQARQENPARGTPRRLLSVPLARPVEYEILDLGAELKTSQGGGGASHGKLAGDVTGLGVCKSKTGVFEKSHEEGKDGSCVDESPESLSRIAAADGGGLACMSGPVAGIS